jgi:Tol biopolymer transport system component
MTPTRKTLALRLAHAAPLALALAGCAAPLAGGDKDIKAADAESLKAVGGKANGLVVWTSSRAGLPHLFTMRTDGSDVRQITKGDMTDWHPRFSPDGRKILFQRSTDEGFVRESDANVDGAWDLYTVNPDGSEISKVIENATWGSWAGPDEIVFLRGSKVMHVKLGSEDEAKIMDTSRYPFFDGVLVEQPELSKDGHFLALTLGGTKRQVGIWNIHGKAWTQLGQGSAIGWMPDGASVYWADDAGKESSRLAREPVVAGTPADERDPEKLRLIDLHGKRSRERFPRVSNDGKWFVFGASITALENDMEDFELYLWEVGSSATSATRLTFHSSNDRWPDIFVGAPGAAPAESAPTAGGAKTAEPEEAAKPAEKAEPGKDEEGAKAEPGKDEEGAKAEPAGGAAEDDAGEKEPAAKKPGKATGKGKSAKGKGKGKRR